MINNALKIEGWMSEVELTWLAHQAKQAKYIVEVGSYLGRSTTALCDNTLGTVYSVDPYSGDYFYSNGSIMTQFGNETLDKFRLNMFEYLVSGKLKHYRVDLSNFFPGNFPYDFIFIDGDHREDNVESDIVHGMGLLKKGGILAGHDYIHTDWPDVKKVVDRMFPNVNLVESIWWIQKF